MSQTKSAPLAGSVEQAQGVRTVPFGWLLLLLLTLSVPLWGLWTSAQDITALLWANGWGPAMGARAPGDLLLQCLISSACSGALQDGVVQVFPPWTWLPPVAGLVLYTFKARPKTYAVRDPGTAWWAEWNDTGLSQYQSNDPQRPGNTLHGYLGHLMSMDRSGSINYPKTIPLYLRMAALSENVLILGGVGAGKTRGYFRPLLMLAAHLGFHVIVFDLKYPQADSGFFDMVGYWKKAGKRVMMFTPFSENTMRLPLLDSVEDYASALSMATTIMPPPEYGPEPGKHYRDRDRGVLAAFLLWVARSDNPSFAELLRMAQYTPEEMKHWFEREAEMNPDGEVVLNLKGVFGQGKQEVASVLQGIKNALRIFFNPKVARATTSKDGENMDIRAAFRSVTTMIYVGIQQEYMMEGDGVVLLQLTKRYIDKQLQREAEFQGGSLKKHVAYVMDEFPSFGQLPYMMRSLGVMRSYNVSHHLGVQNLKQLAVVYGTDYSQALTTNVIGRKIFYPLAVESEEKTIFSETLGMTTVYDIGETDSRRAFLGTSLDDTTRQGVSFRKVAVPLLPPEQFAHFRPMEAVVLGRGANPIRVFMPAIEDEFVVGPGIPAGVPNGLFAHYRRTNPERVNLARYTQQLVLSGALGTVAPAEASGEGAEAESVGAFVAWVREALEEGVRVRFSGENRDRIYLQVGALDETRKPERVMAGNYQRGWTGRPGSDELRLTSEGLTLLPGEVRAQLERRAVFGVLEYWMSRSGALIEGHPEREALAAEDRVDAVAIRKGSGELLLGLTVCRELFGRVPQGLAKRVGSRKFIPVDLENPLVFVEALLGEGEEDLEVEREEERVLPFRRPESGGSLWVADEEEGEAEGVERLLEEG